MVGGGVGGPYVWRTPGTSDRRVCRLQSGGYYSRFTIQPSLRPPILFPHYLTYEQEFYAGGHLSAWKAVPSREGCGVTLRWVADGEVGELVHD